ncbi:MAG: S-layer homology domain-containing protein [Paraclostridium sp.]|uniref:S-layer homology domain-containing protein n=1 Tax=Paraclostridium sp. TaxID=2023273 RepID=UPI003F3907FB
MNNKNKLINIVLVASMAICIGLTKNSYADNMYYKQTDPYVEESKKYKYMDEYNSKDDMSVEIYKAIYNAIINLDDSVDLSKYGVPSSYEVFNIRKKVLDEHPEIFYFTHEGSVYWSNGKLEFKYIKPKEEIKNMVDELNKKVDNILNGYSWNSMSEIEKVIAIHDYLVLNTEYVIANDYAFDVYGILVKGRGVCQGYTMSMKLLLNKIGIDSSYLASPTMNHIWNIINIDGENYQLDATWDDPVPNRKGVVRYSYLAISDNEMSKDHNWDKSKYTKCTSDKYKYMREMDYVVNGNEYRYYTNINDSNDIYKIKKDGSGKEKITNSPGNPLYISGNYLYYKDLYSGNTKKILINNSDSIITDDKADFIDINNHWAQDTIEMFSKNGNINGYSDKTFRPDNSITRAEFVKILNGYFGLTKGSGKIFNDTTNHWAKNQIDIAVTNGVANGISDTLFGPDEPITREQAAKMISNYKKLDDNNYDKLNKYADRNKVSLWAESSVEGVLEAGYMQGYEDNTFRPQNNITRAEAVVTLSRVK